MKDEDASVRIMAADSLGVLKDARAVDPLILALNDNDSNLQHVAARALDKIGDSRSVKPLLAALKNRNLAVIAGADSFFIRRGEPDTEGVLIEALDRYGDSESNKYMSLYFYLSGNKKLEEAAQTFFLKKKGGFLSEDLKKMSYKGPRWGSERK